MFNLVPLDKQLSDGSVSAYVKDLHLAQKLLWTDTEQSSALICISQILFSFDETQSYHRPDLKVGHF